MNQVQRDQSERVASGLMKVLAIIGLIAILAVAAWGSVQLLRFGTGAISRMTDGSNGAAVTLSSLFSHNNKETLSIGLDKTVVNSEEPFAMTINYGGGNDQEYTFTYECVGSTTLALQNVETTATDTSCNNPVTFKSSSSTVIVLPIAGSEKYSDIRMAITVPTKDGGEPLQDTALITVVNEKGVATSSDNKGVSTIKPTSVRQNAAIQPVEERQVLRPVFTGPADLAVTIAATGIVVNGTFYKVTELPATAQQGAVQFSVENKGGMPSGVWAFTAELPTTDNQPYIFTSPAQKSLDQGDKITFTLGFDNLQKSGLVKINVMPIIRENTANNSAQTTITVK